MRAFADRLLAPVLVAVTLAIGISIGSWYTAEHRQLVRGSVPECPADKVLAYDASLALIICAEPAKEAAP